MELTKLSEYEINKELNQLSGYLVHQRTKENKNEFNGFIGSYFSSYLFVSSRLKTGYDSCSTEEEAWNQLTDYCNSLSEQFKYAEKHKIKYAVLYSPEPTKDWAAFPDSKYIFMCGELEEVPSNDLKTGAELLLLVHRETYDNSNTLYNLFDTYKQDNEVLMVRKTKDGYEIFVKTENKEHSQKPINRKTYYRLISLGATEEGIND